MPEFIEIYLPLKYRLPFGLFIFLWLAIVDYKKYGWKSERLHEYGFLIYCVFLAVIYGIANDVITSSLSAEYYTFGKEIDSGEGFNMRVAWLAIKGSYWVGLILGVILLVANNPYKSYPRVPLPKLWKYPLIPIGFTIIFSLTIYLNIHNHYGLYVVMKIHKAAYCGSLVGGLFSLGLVIRSRIKLKKLDYSFTNV
tara:strand:+ start:1459 stop:2046 length:588 start_codon:yes stop_codon:yes gene_type:complete